MGHINWASAAKKLGFGVLIEWLTLNEALNQECSHVKIWWY